MSKSRRCLNGVVFVAMIDIGGENFLSNSEVIRKILKTMVQSLKEARVRMDQDGWDCLVVHCSLKWVVSGRWLKMVSR